MSNSILMQKRLERPVVIHPEALEAPEHLAALWAMHSKKSYQLQQAVKRVFDACAALTLLILLSPMFIVIATLIKLTSEGPIFFKSKRLGKDLKPFYMYKFRTMFNNADLLRSRLREVSKQQHELFKLASDPRVTVIGQFLRDYSLDEFPQLINVLRGEMSLVGPRPFEPDDCSLFKPPYQIRFEVTPGMTGLWQVSGRSSLSFQDLCDLDTQYVFSWSLLNDFRILLRTIPAVLFKDGSC